METDEIYSVKAAKINQDIDEIIKNRVDKIFEKIVLYISHRTNENIVKFIDKYKDDEPSRNYIQKYAETEMNNYSNKMGKFSMVIALIALILSIFPQNPLKPISIIVYLIFLIILIVWLFYIPFEKNLLKTLITKIEDEKQFNPNKEVKSITSKIDDPETDLKIKIEKINMNFSISSGK